MALITQATHDLRSPLNTLQSVISSLHELPEDQQRLIYHSTQRICDITRSIYEVQQNQCLFDETLISTLLQQNHPRKNNTNTETES